MDLQNLSPVEFLKLCEMEDSFPITAGRRPDPAVFVTYQSAGEVSENVLLKVVKSRGKVAGAKSSLEK